MPDGCPTILRQATALDQNVMKQSVNRYRAPMMVYKP